MQQLRVSWTAITSHRSVTVSVMVLRLAAMLVYLLSAGVWWLLPTKANSDPYCILQSCDRSASKSADVTPGGWVGGGKPGAVNIQGVTLFRSPAQT